MAEGGCHCGAVRFAAEATGRVTYCHCRDCRRIGGGPVAVFVEAPASAVRWRGEPRAYRSSVHVLRRFCATCGATLAYEDARLGGEVYFALGAFDRPEDLAPERHAFAGERLPWFETADDLPRHEGFSRPRPKHGQ